MCIMLSSFEKKKLENKKEPSEEESLDSFKISIYINNKSLPCMYCLC